ncbi:cytochrome c-type biogenesis protein CcsB [Jatrophihabitans endophyticus]|uniref:Cytochrome c-type biogenesis protein CcsB n=1 Tax=Jatrophihabitans endophyticus TaxID=1206085 RepID=A0A1M5QZ02_9ACTN|nr:c-type cytochrome biogenesis protein CcsB [Jatrophihabitans endophyticus]SHH19365.1 cytochrome c-type biogenesis protein CcsB [Jatrophihabitans endophyticus]
MSGINGDMAHLSDGLFTTAIAVYALAMVGHTAEYAFGRVGRSAAERAASRQLVGAGGPAVVTPDAPPVAPRPRRRLADRIGRWSVAATVVGAVVHTASILVRAVAVDAVPWSNMYEFASVSGLVAVIAFLGVMWKAPQIRHLGGFILLPVILLMFLAGTVFYSDAQKLVPALQSYWLAIHVFLVSIAEGALLTSAMLTILYLAKSRSDRRLAAGEPARGTLATLAERLPSADTLDKAAYRVVAFSFPLYTVAIICGAIWAEAAWGRYWGWDPKETWAFIVWVVYAGYLHARATAGWKGRSAAWINLAGFTAIIFNFIIVNLVVTGLHSYAGVS